MEALPGGSAGGAGASGPAPGAPTAADPVYQKVGTHELYSLSSRAESGVPGYWAGFRPRPGGGQSAQLSPSDAWIDAGGVFLFCGTDPTGDPAGFLAALAGMTETGVRAVWITDPTLPAAAWTAHRLFATGSGPTWTVTAHLTIPLGGYRLELPKDTLLGLGTAPAAINLAGRPLTLAAPGGAAYPAAGQRAMLPLAGPQVGSLTCTLTLPATPTGPDGLDQLGVQLRYAAPDPADPQRRAVRAVSMPVLRQAGTPLAGDLSVDPTLPVTPSRSHIALFADSASPGIGPWLDSPLRSRHGNPIRLAPVKPASPGPLRAARFAFCHHPLRADAPNDPATPQAYHLAPDGAFALEVKEPGRERDNTLLLGLSGGEYTALATAGPTLAHFDAGRPAYAPGVGVDPAEGAGAGAEWAARPDAVTEPDPKLLSGAGTTAYLAVAPYTPGPSGLVYYAEPQAAPWFSGTGAGALAPVVLPAARLAPNPAGAEQPPAALPIGCYEAVAAADAAAARLIEAAALAPARRAAIADPARGTAGPAIRMLTPQGLFAEASTGTGPEQAAWHKAILGRLPGTLLPELALTSVGPKLRGALQAGELFLVIADPDRYLDDSSVGYGVDRGVLVELAAKGVPADVIAAINRMDPGPYPNERGFEEALPDEALLWEKQVLAAAGMLKAPLDGWTFQLSPRAWRTDGPDPTLMIVKRAGRSLAELAARPESWCWPDAAGRQPEQTAQLIGRILAAAAQAPAGTALADFSRRIANDPAWNGVLFFNAPVAVADLPPELSFVAAGIDPDQFFAHHLAFPLTPIRAAGGGAQPGRSAVDGLIDYHDPAPQAPDDAPPFAFRTRRLNVRFAAGAVDGLTARVALLVNRLFGARVALADPRAGNNLELVGGYQLQDGEPCYTFTLDGPARFKPAGSALESVEVTGVGLRAVTGGQDARDRSSGSAGDEESAVDFTLSGALRFRAPAGFDVFGYGPQTAAPVGEQPKDGFLPFSGLTVRMHFAADEPGRQRFQTDETRITVDPASGRLRPGALADLFPAAVTGLLAVPAPDSAPPGGPGGRRHLPRSDRSGRRAGEGPARGPADFGFTPVLAPLEQSVLQPPWYGLLYRLDLGTLGALAGGAGLTATLLAAWAPRRAAQDAEDHGFAAFGNGRSAGDGSGADGPDDDFFGGPEPVFLGIRFGDEPAAGTGPSIEGVLRFTFGGAEIIETGIGTQRDEPFGYVLRLNRLALSALGVSLPPGGVDLAVFGDPGARPDEAGSAAPAWYAAYEADATDPSGTAEDPSRGAAPYPPPDAGPAADGPTSNGRLHLRRGDRRTGPHPGEAARP